MFLFLLLKAWTGIGGGGWGGICTIVARHAKAETVDLASELELEVYIFFCRIFYKVVSYYIISAIFQQYYE